ncbi:hypothetical protein BC941DRAFT_233544 [Chlamydoabsidia padenii]|nr:hypothetical protein BC941DRAFT_233544 [Chlamydoabsidia padenii]
MIFFFQLLFRRPKRDPGASLSFFLYFFYPHTMLSTRLVLSTRPFLKLDRKYTCCWFYLFKAYPLYITTTNSRNSLKTGSFLCTW